MASTKYTYSIAGDTANAKLDADSLTSEIAASSVVHAVDYVNSSGDVLDIWMKDALSTGDETTLDGVVGAHTGDPVNTEAPKDLDNRVIFHETSREYGLVTYFSGTGDDQADPHAVGGSGIKAVHHHELSDPVSQSLYLDVNAINNKTNIHEGYVQWKDAVNDLVTLEVVPKTTTTSAGTSTNYSVYGGYLIIPAAGDGDTTVADNDRVLVEVPVLEDGTRAGAGYWDATWNTSTKQFDSITANGGGTGQFNMFSVEVVISRFANKIPLLGAGFMQMQTADASNFGHNNRIKLTFETEGTDHEWWANCFMTYHRKKTI